MPFPVKQSYGIICLRRGPAGVIETLLVKRRFTYCFFDFATGRFDATNDDEIVQLLAGMTVEEKVRILSFDFNQIWFWLWLDQPMTRPLFGPTARGAVHRDARSHYDYHFGNVAGRMRLIQLANLPEVVESRHVEEWSPPRGRIESGESELECAVREFHEETGYCREQIFLFSGAKRSHKYVDRGVEYRFTYFFALLLPEIRPMSTHYNASGISTNYLMRVREISESAWFSLDRVQHSYPQLKKLLGPAFRYIKNFMRHK